MLILGALSCSYRNDCFWCNLVLAARSGERELITPKLDGAEPKTYSAFAPRIDWLGRRKL